ncbi:MAG: RimJ/RimL family protein N-acetyltransferase [Gammaproteobacteria bacterium]|jgi:RimJ/RimL family protein N-acetyltransferase
MPATKTNEFDQPIGFAMEDWQPCKLPPATPVTGQYCRIEPFDPDLHNKKLFEAMTHTGSEINWTYLPYGPFDNFDDFDTWTRESCQEQDPMFHTVIDLKSGDPVGIASYLRIVPEQGVIEVGHIHFSPLLQRTALATEAMFLMMRRVFDELGYRRYEWKCDELNKPSCRAAERFGFQFEGIFRQALMYKNRNRDTAWFAIIDQDWPAIKQAFEQWLNVDNFDSDGKQKMRLADLMAKANN